MNRRFRQMMPLILIVLGMMVVTTPAQATLMVDIGGTVIGGIYTPGTVYSDNQAGVDVNPATGIIDVGAFLDSIPFSFIRGFASTSGSPIASLSMNSNSNLPPSAVLPLSMDIVITDTDFSVPPGVGLWLAQTVNLLSAVGGITANATAQGFYGPGNTEFDVSNGGTGVASANLANGIGTNIPEFSGVLNGPTPYSLTMYIHIDIVSRGSDPIQNLQLNADLAGRTTTIPEPSSIMLLGTGLVGLTALFWNKFGRS